MTAALSQKDMVDISQQLEPLRPQKVQFYAPPEDIMDQIGLPNPADWSPVGTEVSCRKDPAIGQPWARGGIPFISGVEYVLSIPLGLDFEVLPTYRAMLDDGMELEIVAIPDASFKFEQELLCKRVPDDMD